MEKLKKLKKNYFDFIVIFGILIVSYLALSLVYDSTKDSFFWHEDRAIHVSIARSLIQGNGFTIDFAPWWGARTTDDLINKYPEISTPQNNKGPIYYIALAGFFKLTSADNQNLYYLGGIFNIFLTGLFLVAYFLFCRKYFSLTVSALSGLVIAALPSLMFISNRAFPHMLEYLLIVTSLLFLKKNNLNYFLFGIFSGLASLTHPIGIIPAMAYTIFLLLKREFKGSLIVFATSTLILFPWFVRNINTFGNFGEGLGIPFALNISKFFGFESISDTIHDLGRVNLPPLGFSEINHFVFFNKLFNNPFEQMYFVLILLIIGLSTIFLIFIFTKRSSKINFTDLKQIKRLGFFSIIYLILTLLGAYFILILDHKVIDPLNILPVIFLIIPFSIFGLYKLIQICTKNKFEQKPIISFFMILLLISLPLAFGSLNSADAINDYNINHSINKSPTKTIHSWVSENISHNSTISTNLPYLLNAKTGMKAIGIPIDSTNNKQLEKYFDHYQPDYVLLYNQKDDLFLSYVGNQYKKLIFESTVQRILEGLPTPYVSKYIFLPNFTHNEGLVKRVVNVLNVNDTSNPLFLLIQAKKLNEFGNYEESEKIFAQVKNNDYYSLDEIKVICQSLVNFERYEDAIARCKEFHEQNLDDLSVRRNLIISYAEIGETKQVFQLAKELTDEVLTHKNSQALPYWSTTMFHIISIDNNYRKLVDDIVKIYYSNEDTARQIELAIPDPKAFQQSRLQNQHHQIHLYHDDVLQNLIDLYTVLADNQDQNRQLLRSYKFTSNERNEADKNLVETLKSKARFQVNLGDYNHAIFTYDQAIGVNKFDKQIWIEKAILLEKLERIPEAIRAYEMALALSGHEDQIIIDKIAEIKEKD